MYDVIIVGAGPAGLTAAVYCLRNKKSVLVLEKEAIGGKIASSPRIDNFPTYKSITGSEFAQKLADQVKELGGLIKFEEVCSIKDSKVITSDNTYESKAIIIASGTHYRTLNLERESEFLGNGISFCTVCDAPFYQGEDVLVVGGANSAMISAITLAGFCNKVYLAVRKYELRGERDLIEEVSNLSNVEILYNTVIEEYLGDDEIEGVIVNQDGDRLNISVSGVFPAIGQDADVNFLDNYVDKDKDNYIISRDDMSTNIPGIFVAGDVRKKSVRQLTTAVSDGTIAALSALEYIKKIDA